MNWPVVGLSLPFLLFTLFGALNWAIRRGLAAPRITGSGRASELPAQAIRLPTANDKQLFAWLIPATPGAPVLVIMHGWGGNGEMMLPLAKPLHAAGYTLLMLDARCHGQSDDDDFASLPRFAEDIEAALDWLVKQPGIDPTRLGVLGHSVGAGATLLAASRRPDIKVAISLAAFAHPAQMMRRWLSGMHIPYWPLGAYILAYVQRTIGYRFEAIAPCHTIKQISCPTLLVHGLDDVTVPSRDAEAIYAGRRHDRVELQLLPGSHDDYGDLERPLRILLDFLSRYLPTDTPLPLRPASP